MFYPICSSRSTKLLKTEDTRLEQRDLERAMGDGNRSVWLPKILSDTNQPEANLVTWSAERKVIHLVELTIHHEGNIDAAHIRKRERYEKLVEECKDVGW